MPPSVFSLESNCTTETLPECVTRRSDFGGVALHDTIDAGSKFCSIDVADSLSLLRCYLTGNLLPDGKLSPVANDQGKLWNEPKRGHQKDRNRY